MISPRPPTFTLTDHYRSIIVLPVDFATKDLAYVAWINPVIKSRTHYVSATRCILMLLINVVCGADSYFLYREVQHRLALLSLSKWSDIISGPPVDVMLQGVRHRQERPLDVIWIKHPECGRQIGERHTS